MRRGAAKLPTLVLFIFGCAIALAVDSVAGPYRLSVTTEPNVVPVGRAKVTIKVTTAQGAPVSDATVKVLARMPGMNMGEREETAVPSDSRGTYTAPATFSMAGNYDVTVSVSSPIGSGQTVLRFSTGQPSTGSSGPNPLLVASLGALLVVAFVVWRMRANGQRVSVAGIFNRNVLLSLGLLALALVAGTWAVQNLRREGAMTPLEAQIMEMNTPAPEGVLPVTVAEVKVEPFARTVSYSGQVVGFVEQEVVPRVTGTIVDMPVYVGDKVKKGQLLARLDTSQIDPMIAETAAGVSSASQGVNVAASELRQALNLVEQARAEAKMAETEVVEARSMLDSARASRTSALAAVDGASAERRSVQAEVDAAVADDTYQKQDLERMRQLFAKGAISKDEWQLALSQAQKAAAALESARQRLVGSDAMLAGARSEVKRSDADVTAAGSRVAKAEANHRAKQAQVRTAESGVSAARARAGQSRAAVSEAGAKLRGATTQKGFSELRAETDGVVTQRFVSPGVVVSPGQAVLKVAQVSPVRIQANVPQQELAKIKVGSEVRVSSGESAGSPLRVLVSSVSPAVDASSRMGVVEAVYGNRDGRFSPGQFVALEIAVGSQGPALVVPAAALVTESHGTETVHKVWVVAAGSPGRLSASLRRVEVSGKSRDKISVRSGLRPGERVVVSPFGLAEGMSVRPEVDPILSTGGAVTIEVTGAGYTPDLVQIPAGKATKIIFVRKVLDTCATSVDFPDLGVHAETPLNEPVSVEIPPMRAGKELKFTCPMDMYRGKVVVK